MVEGNNGLNLGKLVVGLGKLRVELHFADTSYMCRYFRRHAGQSMGEYRRAEAANALQ